MVLSPEPNFFVVGSDIVRDAGEKRDTTRNY
jgi:hypothetical protein